MGARHVHIAKRRASGFTLIEAALTTVIVGTGVLAIVAAQQAYHQKNAWAQRADTGMLLANELRERTMGMPLHDPISGEANYGPESNEPSPRFYDDVDDFAGDPKQNGRGSGLTLSPPMNALGQRPAELSNWSQHVTVENVMPSDISSGFTLPLGTKETGTGVEVVRVKVESRFQSPSMDQPRTVTSMTWILTGK